MHFASLRASSARESLLALLAVVAAATSAFAPSVRAQDGRAGAELWGRILLAGDTMGLSGARVEVVGQAVTRSANQTGFYRFATLTPGLQVLRVRLLGYQPASVEVDLQEGRTERRDIHIERLLTVLTEVRIEGQRRQVPPRFEDVYRRMSTANGRFFTREDIERLNPPDVQSLLMQVGTVRVNFGGIKFARCNEGGNLALSSGGGKVHIYIDGVRMTGRMTRREADEGVTAAEQRDVLKLVIPTQIQALEVYSGVSRIPGEFLEDACAVIAIWTRAY